MKNTNEITMDCKACRSALPDVLFGDTGKRPDVRAHLRACPDCRRELDELKATFALLDEWKAPEPSTYFDTRLKARLREAAEQAPAGLWERLSAWWKFSSNHGMSTLRPAMAGALALVLLVGGGTFATFHNQISHSSSTNVQASGAVNDLRILDNNQQALEQMDQLLDDSNDDGGDSGPTT